MSGSLGGPGPLRHSHSRGTPLSLPPSLPPFLPLSLPPGAPPSRGPSLPLILSLVPPHTLTLTLTPSHPYSPPKALSR